MIGGDYGRGRAADAAPPAEALVPTIPQPAARPDPAEDPETLASREGGLDADALERIATPPRRDTSAPPAADDGERTVRVVGPQFLPDPEEAIDLQVRDPARAP